MSYYYNIYKENMEAGIWISRSRDRNEASKMQHRNLSFAINK